MQIDIRALIASLRIMGEGMLSIFAVMAVIIGVTAALNRLTGRRDEGRRES